jgi:hypothetical protein
MGFDMISPKSSIFFHGHCIFLLLSAVCLCCHILPSTPYHFLHSLLPLSCLLLMLAPIHNVQFGCFRPGGTSLPSKDLPIIFFQGTACLLLAFYACFEPLSLALMVFVPEGISLPSCFLFIPATYQPCISPLPPSWHSTSGPAGHPLTY